MDVDDDIKRIKFGTAFGRVDPTYQQPFCGRCGQPVLQYYTREETAYIEHELDNEAICVKCLRDRIGGQQNG